MVFVWSSIRSIANGDENCNHAVSLKAFSCNADKGILVGDQRCKPGFEPRIELFRLAGYHRATRRWTVHKAGRNGKDLEKVIHF
jgi:hypothetical protein